MGPPAEWHQAGGADRGLYLNAQGQLGWVPRKHTPERRSGVCLLPGTEMNRDGSAEPGTVGADEPDGGTRSGAADIREAGRLQGWPGPQPHQEGLIAEVPKDSRRAGRSRDHRRSTTVSGGSSPRSSWGFRPIRSAGVYGGHRVAAGVHGYPRPSTPLSHRRFPRRSSHAYRPFQTGDRFSRKALTPSLKSALM